MPYVKHFGSVKLVFTSITINELLKTIGVIFNHTFSPIIMSLVNLFWGISMTSKSDVLQQEFSPHQRATMQSIMEVIKGIFGAIVTYLFGFLADFSGPRSAVVATILLKVILLFAVFLLFKTKRKNLKKANLSKS